MSIDSMAAPGAAPLAARARRIPSGWGPWLAFALILAFLLADHHARLAGKAGKD